jgi:hypothetical protein
MRGARRLTIVNCCLQFFNEQREKCVAGSLHRPRRRAPCKNSRDHWQGGAKFFDSALEEPHPNW